MYASCRSEEMEAAEAKAFAAEAISDTYINVTEGDAIGIITIEVRLILVLVSFWLLCL